MGPLKWLTDSRLGGDLGTCRECTGHLLSKHHGMRSSMPGGVGGGADNAGDDGEYKGKSVLSEG